MCGDFFYFFTTHGQNIKLKVDELQQQKTTLLNSKKNKQETKAFTATDVLYSSGVWEYKRYSSLFVH